MNKKKLYRFFSLLSIAGYMWVAWNVFERSGRPLVPTVCLFKEITGVPCPSCGTTRSITMLIRGNIKESLLVNPFGLVMALALLVIPLWITVDTLRSSDSFYKFYGKMEHLLVSNKWISVSAVIIVLVNWFWNIEKGL